MDLLPLPSGFIDSPVPDAVLGRDLVTLRGWALFEAGPPTRVDLWLGDTPLGPARLGGRRDDIVDQYGAHGLACAWEHQVDLAAVAVPDGRVDVRAVAHGPDGARYEAPVVTTHVASPVGEQNVHQLPAVRVGPRAARAGGPMRVLVFTHRLDLGGAQLVLLDLLTGLRMLGVECTLVSPLDGELRQRVEAAGVRVHISASLPVDDAAQYAGRVTELAAWASLGDHDVVLVNTALAFHAGEVARALGIPAVWLIHESCAPTTLWQLVHPGMHPEVRRRAVRSLRGASAGVFVAASTQAVYEDWIDGACVTRPYGLDMRALRAARRGFDRAGARRERGIGTNTRVVLSVGTIEPRKAQVPLVQAFAAIADRHPDAGLVFVGAREDDPSRLLRDVARGLRVRVVDMLPQTWPWYGLADLYVCASDLESLPRSVLEAMAWETPVVATSVFGLPDVVREGDTGWLCAPRDVDSLARALDAALSAPPAEARRRALAGRALVESRHDRGAYAAWFDDLLGTLSGVTTSRPASRASSTC